MPTNKEIIDGYTKLGELVAKEISLGEQLIQLSIEQRKAHNDTRLAREALNELIK